MESFSVTCTTCQQRLGVRDESVIGEIQICPKCGSMVLIQPPSDPPADVGDAPPISADQAVPSDPLLSDPLLSDPLPSDPLPPPVAGSDREGVETESPLTEGGDFKSSENADYESGKDDNAEGSEDLGAETPPTKPPLPETDAPPVAIPPQVSPRDEDEQFAATPGHTDQRANRALLPPKMESEESSQNRYLWLWGGGAALAGVILAFGLFGFIASRHFASQRSEDSSLPPEVATAETGVEEVDPAVEPQPDSGESETAVTEDTTSAPPSVDPVSDHATPDNTTSRDAASDDAASDDTTSSDSESDDDASDEPPDRPAVTSPETIPIEGDSATPPATTTAGEQQTPTEDSQTATENSQTESTPSTESPSVSSPPEGTMAATLDTFAPFIDPQSFVPTPGAPPPVQEDQPELEPVDSDDDVQDVPRPEPREVDVAARLADKIPSIEFQDVPLKAFIRFLMGFSTIPITLDPDALMLLNVTPETRINLQLADTTVGLALGKAIYPLGLGAQRVDDQILITRVTTADPPLRTYPHPVDDLVAGDAKRLDSLAEMIMDMVQPNSWEPAGGEGTIRPEMPSLVIRQRETGLFRAIVFCERLRTARGLALRSKFDRSLFALEPRFVRATDALRHPVTLNYIEPTSFVQIVDQLSDESGLQILIDWRELAGLGWNPAAETTVSANADPVGEVLGGILRPMGLTYRVLGSTCVQVTSPEKLESQLDVEFYPAADLLSAESNPDELLARIRAELGEQMLDELGATLGFDSPSGFLIAALPQPLQRKVPGLLKTWRTVDTPAEVD